MTTLAANIAAVLPVMSLLAAKCAALVAVSAGITWSWERSEVRRG